MLGQSANQFLWMVRREFWEHKAIIVVPLVMLGILTLTDLVAVIQGSAHLGMVREHIGQLKNVDTSTKVMVVEAAFFGIGAFFAIAMAIVAVFYLLDCLYSERRDRSVLFWKSLPLTDSSTVLSKFFTGVVAIPFMGIIATFLAYLVLIIIATLIFGLSDGFPLGSLWNPLNIGSSMFKSMVFTYSVQLWMLPVLAWLLFCSAFARKTPILFAILIPAGIELAEYLAVGRSRLSDLQEAYFSKFFEAATDGMTSIGISNIEFANGQFSADGGLPGIGLMFSIFKEPYLYGGLAVAAAFVAASIWWRRNRIDHG